MVRDNESAVSAAIDKAALARDQITVGVADAVNSGVDAARNAKAMLDEKLEGLIDSGKDVIDQAEDLIRTRPWASFGAAFAAGYLIAKLTRGKD
jgi:ElaB/YqjD/DUF883 family membrane-anchored ribosome-binding protein